jgi:hypothetical protein
MLPLKQIKLTLDSCNGGLLRATFYIQFIVLFKPFKIDVLLVEAGRFFVITPVCINKLSLYWSLLIRHVFFSFT